MSKPEHLAVSAIYRPKNGTVIHAENIRHAWLDLDAYDVGAFVPVGKKWAGFGRQRFDRKRSRSVHAFLGIQYKSCCMTLRVLAQQELRPARSLGELSTEKRTSLLLQIGLMGLGTLGSSLESVLSGGIPGLSGVEKDDWIGKQTVAW